ncbi:MAG: excinuclease ABC subunit UvrC [Candidatus Aureabacteria bacterium]|nr:excinuclease ABC subunit UvrC [Candidatus Auribacterota bacterium]
MGNVSGLLQEKIRNVPASPGVYLFSGHHSEILYIGKALDLKKRMSSYLKKGGDNRPQIPRLMESVRDIQFIATKTEREALILESTLIKQNHPRFNIALKDDKTFKTIMVDVQADFPRIGTVRKYQPGESCFYFGPFCGSKDARICLEQLSKLFLLRDCKDSEFKSRKRPCLKYQMKLCSAPCCGFVSREAYRQQVQSALHFLQGKNKDVLMKMREKIKERSRDLKFEEAHQLYHQMHALERMLQDDSSVSGYTKDTDVIACHEENTHLIFQVLIIRGQRVISSDTKTFQDKAGTLPEFLKGFIEQYYGSFERIPPEIWVQTDPDDRAYLEEVLSQRKQSSCRIVVPRTQHGKKAMQMAMDNARMQYHYLFYSRKQSHDFAVQIKKIFLLKKPVFHMECYDISHYSGKDQVGVKVSYHDLKPCKNEYRRYLIRASQKGDDYSSLYEVLKRRIQRGITGEDKLPDLFILDGGLGQLSVLKRVSDEFHLEIDGIAIAKESHSKSSKDQIYSAGRLNPVRLKRSSQILLKIMEIRDEAHRFAISFHKHKREKRLLG